MLNVIKYLLKKISPSRRPAAVLSTAVAIIISNICAADIIPGAATTAAASSTTAAIMVVATAAVGLFAPEVRGHVTAGSRLLLLAAAAATGSVAAPGLARISALKEIRWEFQVKFHRRHTILVHRHRK